MYCTNCGKKLPDNAAFCTECGAAINADNKVPGKSAAELPSVPKETEAAEIESVQHEPPVEDKVCGSEDCFVPDLPEDFSCRNENAAAAGNEKSAPVSEFGSGTIPEPEFIGDDPENKMLSDKNTSHAKVILAVCVAVLLAAVVALYFLISAGVKNISNGDDYGGSVPEGGFDILEDDSYANPQVESSRTQIIVLPDYECYCPFTAEVSSDYDYYIYLRYIGEPYESYDDRSSIISEPEISDMSCYVKAGESISFDVPIGVYELYYACGNNWQGAAEFFGEEGIYLKSGDELVFYSDEKYFQGVTVNLLPESGSNLNTEYIDINEFPYLPF